MLLLSFCSLKICGDDKLCLFDIAATGDLSIGDATKETGEELESLNMIFQSSTISLLHTYVSIICPL